MEKKEEPEEPQVEVDMTSNWDQTVETFDELNLKPLLLRGIYGYGFEKPSPIQQKAILPIIQGRDVIAQAQVIFYIFITIIIIILVWYWKDCCFCHRKSSTC